MRYMLERYTTCCPGPLQTHGLVAQMVARHTEGGYARMPGELLGTGTLSGLGAGEHGRHLEFTCGGREALMLAAAAHDKIGH